MEVTMTVAITRTEMTASELRRAASSCRDADASRRMLALALVFEGAPRAEAARSCGMDRQTLRDWVHRYNDEGLPGLSNRSGQGRKPLLDDDQRARLADLVRKGPDPEQDGVVRWRRVDLKRRIEHEFDVVMHERTVGAQLAALGFRRLSVRPQHPNADEEAQEAFKKTSPPR